MKFIKPIIIILTSIAILVAVILSYLLLSEEVVEVDWFSVESGNTPGNIVNGGRVARQGDWVFKAYYRDRAGIYKVNIDGSGLKRLNTDPALDINVVGDWIYYSNLDDGYSIYKIRTDGTERKKLNDMSSTYLYVVDGWIYFHDWCFSCYEVSDILTIGFRDSSVSRIRTNGSEYSKVIDGNVSVYAISGSWLYYTNWNDAGRIYRANLSGTDKFKISENVAASSLQLYGEWIYYTSEGPRFYEQGLYRSRTNGTKDELIVEGYVGTINVFDGWIYYTDKNDDHKLYKIRTDGWGRKKINNTRTSSVSFDGIWVYYTDKSGDFKIRPDGTGRQLREQFH